ncbi:MAG TPA: efflux RND transporter permease subunit, partial [Albitalea sp.]|nr:efflux RND transporter permease subunit [Albitalea sp.]
AVALPLSVLMTFIVMRLLGYSLDNLSLMGLTIALGFVIDDAIVMLENIYRHIEEGMAPFAAAIKGAKEVGFAVVAMTLTLAAVFAPLAFTPGRTGRLFIEFALTLAGAVVVSGFVALTLTPMMCSKLLRHNPAPNRFDRGMEALLVRITALYRGALVWTLGHRWLVVLLMLASGAVSAWLFTGMKRELSPIEDRGVILTVVNAPDGSTIGYTEKYMQEIEKIGMSYPEFDRVFVVAGNPTVAQGVSFLRATDWSERKRSTPELAQSLIPRFAGLPGVTAFPITPPSLGQGFRERPLNFVILTSDSYANLAQVTQAFLAEMAKNPGLVQPDSDLRLNKPEIYLEVDRERAADLGISVETVVRSVETMLGGRQVTRYKRDADQFDVIVQTDAIDRNVPTDIERIFVRGRNDAMIPLSALVNVRESVSPRELNHFNQRRSVSITANLSPSYSLGEALAFMDQTATALLKPGYSTELNGVAREFKSASGSLGLVFVLALVFIFLVLSAQFESFVDPLVILLSVPLSMVGALAALQLSGGTSNVYSQIGLITLVGLITKHGILIVEFSNQLRRAGRDTLQAVTEAATMRLRPIMMTTGAMVLGAVPLAIASGAGAESRQQIGWVIVGGMSLGTLLTIFVVPTMYTLFARSSAPGANTTPVASEESRATA